MKWPFQTKAAPVRELSEAPKQPQVIYLNNGTGIGIIEHRDHIAMENAMRHPIIHRALDKLALSVQQARWEVVVDKYAAKADQAGKAGVIKDLQALLDSPNPEMTPAQLRYWMTLNYAGYGRVPLKIGFSATKPTVANGIYPLEVAKTIAVINDRGAVDSYKYGMGEGAQTWPSRRTWKPGARDGFVSQIWKPGLKGYQNREDVNSPLTSIGLPAQVITSLLIRAFKTANGQPNVRYLVTCSRTLTAPQKDALKKYLNDDHGPEGPDSGRVPILQNAGDVEIHKLDNDLSDIHSKMPSDDMARLIFGAFGIPIALAGMGAADGAKFAGNYEASQAAFWNDTVIPAYLNPILQGMTQILCPAGVAIVPDYDTIPALVAARTISMREMAQVNFLTTNEKREHFGWGPTTEITPIAPPPNQSMESANGLTTPKPPTEADNNA